MFGVEDLSRSRLEEARKEGLRSQFIYNSRGEQPKSAPRRILEVIVTAILHVITLRF